MYKHCKVEYFKGATTSYFRNSVAFKEVEVYLLTLDSDLLIQPQVNQQQMK